MSTPSKLMSSVDTAACLLAPKPQTRTCTSLCASLCPSLPYARLAGPAGLQHLQCVYNCAYIPLGLLASFHPVTVGLRPLLQASDIAGSPSKLLMGGIRIWCRLTKFECTTDEYPQQIDVKCRHCSVSPGLQTTDQNLHISLCASLCPSLPVCSFRAGPAGSFSIFSVCVLTLSVCSFGESCLPSASSACLFHLPFPSYWSVCRSWLSAGLGFLPVLPCLSGSR